MQYPFSVVLPLAKLVRNLLRRHQNLVTVLKLYSHHFGLNTAFNAGTGHLGTLRLNVLCGS